MSHKIWIALTSVGLLFLPLPALSAVRSRQFDRSAEVAAPNGLVSTAKPRAKGASAAIEISPLPTVTELKVTELSTQEAMVQPEVAPMPSVVATDAENAGVGTAAEIAPIPVVAFVEQPEQKMRQTAIKLGAALQARFDSPRDGRAERAHPQASLDTIQPTKLPEFFPRPSHILGEAANKADQEVGRSTQSTKSAATALGPLDSAPVETIPVPTTPEVKPTENILQTQTGQASWYGYEAGNMTATGERYNAQAMTAAHRTLPFGTRVRVINTRTGKSAIVRINDRGPFIRGRIIDLSAAAADAVGIKSSGVGNVRLEVLSYGSGKRRTR
jgi:rare lipoprotein A (peptidoglycan hydrolase)